MPLPKALVKRDKRYKGYLLTTKRFIRRLRM
jgi:hypothetical protein